MAAGDRCLPVDDDVRRAGCAASARRALVRDRAARFNDILDGWSDWGSMAESLHGAIAGCRRTSGFHPERY